jgi:hypothetical protein
MSTRETVHPGAPDLRSGPRKERSRTAPSAVAMLFCLAVALATLVALVAQVAIKGAGSLSGHFFTDYASSFRRTPASARRCWAPCG